jgi:hypothetical protein
MLRRWRCGVCQEKCFENFDEACRHEEQCKIIERVQQQENEQPSEVELQLQQPAELPQPDNNPATEKKETNALPPDAKAAVAV